MWLDENVRFLRACRHTPFVRDASHRHVTQINKSMTARHTPNEVQPNSLVGQNVPFFRVSGSEKRQQTIAHPLEKSFESNSFRLRCKLFKSTGAGSSRLSKTRRPIWNKHMEVRCEVIIERCGGCGTLDFRQMS